MSFFCSELPDSVSLNPWLLSGGACGGFDNIPSLPSNRPSPPSPSFFLFYFSHYLLSYIFYLLWKLHKGRNVYQVCLVLYSQYWEQNLAQQMFTQWRQHAQEGAGGLAHCTELWYEERPQRAHTVDSMTDVHVVHFLSHSLGHGSSAPSKVQKNGLAVFSDE